MPKTELPPRVKLTLELGPVTPAMCQSWPAFWAGRALNGAGGRRAGEAKGAKGAPMIIGEAAT